MKKTKNLLYALSLTVISLLLPIQASAVGGGLKFRVSESNVPGTFINKFSADSLDLTYHGCSIVNSVAKNSLNESGYFWISSYQRPSSVVDSQLNYYLANGYRIYARYRHQMQQVGAAQPTPSGSRLNYVLNLKSASIVLFLDVNSDTVIKQARDCRMASDNTGDDIVLGKSSTAVRGEKSETNGLANGDFEIIYSNWSFNTTAPENPIILDPNAKYYYMSFNANVTRLRNALGVNHMPEGSGNLYWFDNVKLIIDAKRILK